jgi:hypothetical protein
MIAPIVATMLRVPVRHHYAATLSGIWTPTLSAFRESSLTKNISGSTGRTNLTSPPGYLAPAMLTAR